jgi:hypothetical protein
MSYRKHPLPSSMADMFEKNEQEPIMPTGAQLRNLGMEVAVEHAEAVEPDWKQTALRFVKKFVSYTSGEFMTEDVRMASLNGGVPEPPSKRAWGAVIVEAAKNGWIKRKGYGTVKNPKAHRTPAAIWVKA